ncbi:MAG TPA: type II secretion system F family protein, partial [Gemmatimonadaceae bacterium]|nr:type II secretion system F family protein [Gemmatimonadaceae bacterium]
MSTFIYEVVDRSGHTKPGRAEAATAAALTRRLEGEGLMVLDMQERSEGGAAGAGWRPGRRQEVLEVTRAMAALLPAGMPLAQALSAAANVTESDVQGALHTIRTRVERGESLALALSAYPHLFPPLYVGLVRAGEKSGRLDDAFARLASQLEREAALRSKILSAMIYPMLLATVGSIAVTVLLLF